MKENKNINMKMRKTLIVMSASLKDNAAKLKLINELKSSINGQVEFFWQNGDSDHELKKLLIDTGYDEVIIAFFDLMGSDIPEFQVIKSLALQSRIVLFNPDMALLRYSRLARVQAESEVIKWQLSGRNALMNIFKQADLVVTSNEEEVDLLAGTEKIIASVKKEDYFKGKYSFLEKNKKKVSIIILTYNQLVDTKCCVESLEKYTRPAHEIIFVDNGSADGTVEYLESLKSKYDNVKLITNKTNLGFSKANNQGISIAEGDYILLLNNDVILTEAWLERMLACAENDPAAGVIGPSTNRAVGQQVADVQVENNDKSILRAASVQLIKNAGCWSEVHRIIGFCMLIKKEVIDKIGMLDEQFGPGGFEDYDYCLRVNQAGYKIMIANDVFIYHIGGRGYSGNNLDYDKLRQHNVQLFIEKWCRRALEILETL